MADPPAAMADPPPAAVPKRCCVCDEPSVKRCGFCKWRHYCSEKCRCDDWHGGHEELCDKLATCRLLDSLVQKEQEATAAAAPGGAPTGSEAAWRGTCASCAEVLPPEAASKIDECCCSILCVQCAWDNGVHNKHCRICRTFYDNWLRKVTKGVEAGLPAAQMDLADAFFEGRMGIGKDVRQAFKLFEAAAAQGHADAQNSLGACYQLGDGVEIDAVTAALWLRRAAEQGHAGAQSNLGTAYDEGDGVAQSYEEAFKWYRLAARNGDLKALYNLGACYANGQGAPMDYLEALSIWDRAAVRGYDGAIDGVQEIRRRLTAMPPWDPRLRSSTTFEQSALNGGDNDVPLDATEEPDVSTAAADLEHDELPDIPPDLAESLRLYARCGDLTGPAWAVADLEARLHSMHCSPARDILGDAHADFLGDLERQLARARAFARQA